MGAAGNGSDHDDRLGMAAVQDDKEGRNKSQAMIRGDMYAIQKRKLLESLLR